MSPSLVLHKKLFQNLRRGFHYHRRNLAVTQFLCRESFVRDKLIANLVTLGATQHGKTTLASKMTKALSQEGVTIKEIDDIDHSVSERENKRSEHVSHMEIWQNKSDWRISLADLPGGFAYLKNSLNHLPHCDAALLIISAEHGIDEDTRTFYYIAKHLNIPLILPVVVVRGETCDEETLELIKMEMDELEGVRPPHLLPDLNEKTLTNFLDSICDLLSQTIPDRPVGQPFCMALEQVGNIPKRGDFCAGRVLQGKISVGDQLEAFYQGKTSKANVKDIEIYRKGAEFLQAGDRGGIFLKLKTEMDLKRGGVLYNSKIKLNVSDEWKVSLKSISGSGKSVLRGDSVFYYSTITDGKVSFGGQLEVNEETESAALIKLSKPISAKSGDKFIVRNNQLIVLGTFV